MREVHSLYSPSAVSAQATSQQLRDVLRIGVFRKHNFLQYHEIQSVGKCQDNITIALANWVINAWTDPFVVTVMNNVPPPPQFKARAAQL